MSSQSSWPLWAWLMVGFTILALGIGSLGGLFLPALILDLASFWPLFLLGLAIGAALWARRKRGSGRLQVVAPLLILVSVAVVLTVHILRWSALPSSSGDLSGPAVGSVREADFAVTTSGRLAMSAGREPLYVLHVGRRGGQTGVPEALEAIDETQAIVRVQEQSSNRWFRSSGWSARLSVQPAWTIDLTASELDADLRGLSLAEANLKGAGSVALPVPAQPTDIQIAGDFTVTVPAGSAVEILGDAAVPSHWSPTEVGWLAPVSGSGYRITVLEGTVEVIER